MELTPREKWLLAALVVLVIIVAGCAWRHSAWMKKHCICVPDGKATFTGDLDGWPTAGTFGNLPDTNPYGNYADGRASYWPTYEERNTYWTRS